MADSISVKNAALSYEVSFFLHYGWFFQNLGKEAVQTFMHMTVRVILNKYQKVSFVKNGNEMTFQLLQYRYTIKI